MWTSRNFEKASQTRVRIHIITHTHTPLNDNQKSEHHPPHKIQSEFRALPSKPDLEFGAPPHHPPPEMPRKHHRHTGYQ